MNTSMIHVADCNFSGANFPKRNTPFSHTDLIINEQGRIYHLDLHPDELAPHIVIVGDPERVPFMADEFMRSIEVDREHRGLRSVTGIADETGQRISFITSGMGTPSLEIIVSELVALKEIDFNTRQPKSSFEKMNLIRVGTSGGLQADTTLGTSIITSYSIGMDNTGLFYETPPADEHCERIENELADLIAGKMKKSRFFGMILPYVSKSDDRLREALLKTSSEEKTFMYKEGLTASNSGFFANQGRHIARLAPSIPNLDTLIGSYDPGLKGQRVENMEMESSFLFHYLQGLGHSAVSVCPTVAHRVSATFANDYQSAVKLAGKVAIRALSCI